MLKKFSKLIKIIEEHHQDPVIQPDKRHLGIILTLVGFLLYAFYTIIFQIESNRDKETNTFASSIFEFTIFNFFMFLSFLPFILARGKKYFKCKEPKLIITRAFFANICIWFYSLARIWTKDVDNSMLYSTDGFWVVLIMLFLGMKVSRITWLGVLVGIGGIFFIYFFDLSSINDLVGGAFGTISGISLAIVILLTRYMVKKDPPTRIGLYHALISFIFFAVASIIVMIIPNNVSLPDLHAIIMMMLSGFLFALTLFCFLEAFYYTESYIIAAVSFFLPVFTETINWIINQTVISWTTIVGSLVTTIGGLIVISSSYMQDKKEKKHLQKN